MATFQKQAESSFLLATGKLCQLIRVRNELIPDYYVLVFSRAQGQPTAEEVSEMLVLGVERAQELALDHVGDQEAFAVLYSGYSARREKGWHVHIVLLGSRWRKAWLYLVLAGKNLLQALNLRKDDAPRVAR